MARGDVDQALAEYAPNMPSLVKWTRERAGLSVEEAAMSFKYIEE